MSCLSRCGLICCAGHCIRGDVSNGQPERVWIGPKEAATLLEVSPRYIYEHHEDTGWPRSMRIGRLIKWRRADFVQWIEKRLAASAR